MQRRWLFPAVTVFAFAALLTFKAQDHKPPPPSAGGVRIADATSIPVILPLTGSGSFLGRAEQQALQYFEKEAAAGAIPGVQPVKFSYFDDQSSPQVTVQLLNQIKLSKPPVVIGSAMVSMCNAMAPLVKTGPVVYCLSPGIHPHPGSYVYTASSSTRDLVAATLTYFHERGIKRIGLITSIDASGQDVRRSLPELIADPSLKGLELVDNVFFNPGDISASAQIEHMKARHPEAIIVWSTGAAVGIVLKGLAQAGVDVPVATTDGNMTLAQMRQYAPIMPRELLIPSPAWMVTEPREASPKLIAVRQGLLRAYRDAPDPPDFAAAAAWDPALIVASLYKPGMKAEELRLAMANLTAFPGTSGTYDMKKTPQRGLDIQSVVMTRWNAKTEHWDPISGAGGTLAGERP